MSDVEIVRQFLASQGRARRHGAVRRSTRRRARSRCSAPTPACPTTGWGVIVQVEERKAYYSALQMRDQSFWLVALVDRSWPWCWATLFAREISRPIDELARGARRLAGRRLRHPRRGEERQRGRRAGRRLQPDGRGDPEGRSSRSARRPRATRSCSWAPSACWRTPSTRRTPTRAATPSAWPSTRCLIAKHLGMSAGGGRARAPVRHHPRRGQDRHRGQDPAQAGGADRRRVRDHEAAPAQGRAHPGGGARCSSRWPARA